MIPVWFRTIPKRVFSGLMLKHTALLALSVLTIWLQMAHRIPSRVVILLLPLIGLTLALAYFSLLVIYVTPADAPLRRTFIAVEQRAAWLIVALAIGSTLVFFNGRLDASASAARSATIVAIAEDVRFFGLDLPVSWADFAWRDRIQEPLSLLLWESERDEIWTGQAVTVQLHQGAFGIPWVGTLKRDDEAYYRQVLEVAPRAAEIWKTLARHYLADRQWDQATDVTLAYLNLYPRDLDFAKSTAAVLGQAHQDALSARVLERFLATDRDYELLLMAGWNLHHTGDQKRAIELMTSAIPLDPGNWWAYYHLGYAYSETNRPNEAIAMFEKVLELHPTFPEIEQQLATLRHRVAATTRPQR